MLTNLKKKNTVLEARITALETETKKMIRELNEHHTIYDLHRDVIEAVEDVNRELDAALLDTRLER